MRPSQLKLNQMFSMKKGDTETAVPRYGVEALWQKHAQEECAWAEKESAEDKAYCVLQRWYNSSGLPKIQNLLQNIEWDLLSSFGSHFSDAMLQAEWKIFRKIYLAVLSLLHPNKGKQHSLTTLVSIAALCAFTALKEVFERNGFSSSTDSSCKRKHLH